MHAFIFPLIWDLDIEFPFRFFFAYYHKLFILQ